MMAPTLKPRVLIVEDDPDLLVVLRVNLTAMGVEPILAGDGRTAISRIQAERPDAVILDEQAHQLVVLVPLPRGGAVGNRQAQERHRGDAQQPEQVPPRHEKRTPPVRTCHQPSGL